MSAHKTAGWRPAPLAREAYLNVRSGRWLSVAIIIGIMTATVVALLADASAVSAIHRSEQQFLANGGNIISVSGTDANAHVNAAACSALSSSPDVIASSAISTRPNGVRITGRPETIQSVHYATAGFEKIAGSSVSLRANQAISSEIVAQRWLITPGSYLGFEPDAGLAASVHIADVVDLSRLGDAFSTTLIMVAPATGTADTCLILAQPNAIERVILNSPASLGDTSSNPLRASNLQDLGEYFVPFHQQYDERPTQHLPIIMGLALGLVAILLIWMRRGRYALYSTLGLSRGHVAQLRIYEWALYLLLGVVPAIAIALVVALAQGLGSAQGLSALSGAVTPINATYWAASMTTSGLLVGLCAGALVALTAPLKPATLAALKER